MTEYLSPLKHPQPASCILRISMYPIFARLVRSNPTTGAGLISPVYHFGAVKRMLNRLNLRIRVSGVSGVMG